MSPSLLIYGAGGHGRVVADIAELSGFARVAFADAAWPEQTSNLAWPIISNEYASLSDFTHYFVAIGNNQVRKQHVLALQALGKTLPVLIHPTGFLSKHSQLGEGSIVMAGAAVNAGATLGKGVIINTGATVDHDCIVGDFVHISPGVNLAGGIKVEAGAWIGIGSCIREGCRIGEGAIVAGGATVIRDVKPGETVYGNPAQTKSDK
ncbi:MAG: acetyltransferase [Pirellulales bacterium]